jgi:Arc/MetJ-type ribon-helix-helix transcriptional regulator
LNDKEFVQMSKPMTLNVRVGGTLGDFVAANVGDDGAYENVSEYVRDLIRRDKERVEAEGFARLKAELTAAFATPEASFAPMDAGTIINRNPRR